MIDKDISEAVERASAVSEYIGEAYPTTVVVRDDGLLVGDLRTLLDAATKATALQAVLKEALRLARERTEIGSTEALFNVLALLARKDN